MRMLHQREDILVEQWLSIGADKMRGLYVQTVSE